MECRPPAREDAAAGTIPAGEDGAVGVLLAREDGDAEVPPPASKGRWRCWEQHQQGKMELFRATLPVGEAAPPAEAIQWH